MTEKEMRRLSRAELLELLLVQTKETERLREKLKKTEAMLADRYLRVQKAGDLAHAVLEINEVALAVQEAAQQYLDNIVTMEQETRLECQRILAEAQAEANRLRSGTKQDAQPGAGMDPLFAEIIDLIEEN